MAIAQVGTHRLLQASNGGTTSSLDTTGANFLLVSIAYNNTPAVSDSKSNTWTPLTLFPAGGNKVRFWYVENATVGTGHTFTVSGSSIFCCAIFTAWSGVKTTGAFDQEAGHEGIGFDDTTPQTGPITPTENNELVVATRIDPNANPTGHAGYTSIDQQTFVGGTSFPSGLIYQVQTTATTADPQWTFGIGTFAATFISASFKESGAAAATSDPGGWRVVPWRRSLGRR